MRHLVAAPPDSAIGRSEKERSIPWRFPFRRSKRSMCSVGNRDLSSGKKISPFDLRNWKWVECKSADENFNAVISLDMPETDLSSGNAHSLYDRIGLIVTYTRRNNYYKTSIWTDIDLPLDERLLEKIAGLIVEQFGIYNWIDR